jgi:hypothetical protein
MARADYHAQLVRHAGEFDVLPGGLVVPSLPHGSDWRRGYCRGIALLTAEVLHGNRWPAVSGALLAELAQRCARLAAFTVIDAVQRPAPRHIEVRFRKAIPVAEPRRAPHVADGSDVLYWSAAVETEQPQIEVAVELSRQLDAGDVVAVEARARFDPVAAPRSAGGVERRMSDYLLSVPRRLALPCYEAGWTASEVRGRCVEAPGSLLAAAEQALGDAGKIVRGQGVPPDLEESMLLADMSYRWLDDVEDGRATYVARAGARREDERKRIWVTATATLALDGRPVGEAEGSLVLRAARREPRASDRPSPTT